MNAGTTANPYYRTTTSVYQAPRFDHNPSTLAPRGLLVEGQAVNPLRPSDIGHNCYNTVKIGGAGLEPATTVTGIDGLQSAVSFTLTSSGGTPFLDARSGTGTSSSLQSLTVNTQYTFSFYWKSSTSSTLTTRVFESGSGVLLGGSTFTETPGPNGFTRRVVVFTTGAVITNIICAWGYGNHAIGAEFTVTAGQLETGSGASSYIPTGSSQATRVADVATMPVSSIAFNQTAGTIYSDLEVGLTAFSTFPPINTFNTSGSGTAQRCWSFGRFNRNTSSGTRLLSTSYISGGTVGINSNNYVYNSGNGGRVKYAIALDTSVSSMVIVIAGGSPQTVTASAFTLTTAATLALNSNVDLLASELGSMWIARLVYWPSALPTATMQALTT